MNGPIDIRPRCCDCAYWAAVLGHDEPMPIHGDCRRHAPQFQSAASAARYPGQDPDQGGWPYTLASDWCGEHSALAGKPVITIAREERQ
jgi:hypothetical protein